MKFFVDTAEIADIKKLKEMTASLLARKKVVETLQSNRADVVHLLDELAGQHARDASSGALTDFPNDSQHDHEQEERERGDRTPDPSEELIAG